MIKRTGLLLLIVFAGIQAQSQEILFEEGFDSGIPSGWTMYDLDMLTPAAAVEEFNMAWIGRITGSDTSAASTSFYEPTGRSNDYLVTPKLTIGNFSRFIWSARSVDPSHPDGYQVLISTTDSLAGSFTDTLMTINEEQPTWEKRTIELDLEGYANQDIYIAFQNNTDDGFILLLDDIKLLGAETAGLLPAYIPEKPTIYPNPSNDFVRVEMKQEDFINASVYSPDGRLVLFSEENKLDVRFLANGTYYLVVETTNGPESTPFLKQ